MTAYPFWAACLAVAHGFHQRGDLDGAWYWLEIAAWAHTLHPRVLAPP